MPDFNGNWQDWYGYKPGAYVDMSDEDLRPSWSRRILSGYLSNLGRSIGNAYGMNQPNQRAMMDYVNQRNQQNLISKLLQMLAAQMGLRPQPTQAGSMERAKNLIDAWDRTFGYWQ